MSNKAKNDKSSILVDVENLLDVFEPAFMNMPKIRRLHGAAVRMEDAAYDIIHYFSVAYAMGSSKGEMTEKLRYIGEMIGAYGRMQSCFKRLVKIRIDTQRKPVPDNPDGVEEPVTMSLFSDGAKLEIARCMERLEEGISKWRNSIKSNRVMLNEWSDNNQEARW